MDMKFLRAALIRALHAVCQTAIGVIGSSAVLSEIDFRLVASSCAVAFIVSLLKSFSIGMPECLPDDDKPDGGDLIAV